MANILFTSYPKLKKALSNSCYLGPYLPLAFTGSRTWKDKSLVSSIVLTANKEAKKGNKSLVLLHGGCETGLDKIVANLCEAHGIFNIVVPAPWKMGLSAGPKRNALLLQTAFELGTKYLLAFPEPHSKGTINCMNLGNSMGFRVIDFGSTEPE